LLDHLQYFNIVIHFQAWDVILLAMGKWWWWRSPYHLHTILWIKI